MRNFKRKRSVSAGKRFKRRSFSWRRIRRRMRVNRNSFHTFRRMFAVHTITDAVAGNHKAYAFTISQVSEWTELAKLYDAYKIRKVVLRIEPTFNSNLLSQSSATSNKCLRIVHDYDDSTALVNEDAYLQYGNCKSYYPTRGAIRVTLYPKVAAMLYRTDLTTGYTQKRAGFIDNNQDDVPHYGIKVYYPYLGMNGAETFKVYATMHFTMKDTR